VSLFQLGNEYTRRQIHIRVGGNMQNALPTVNKVVVAACLHADAAHNPDAPDVILCGNGERVAAAGAWLSAQPEPIPVFVFNAPHRWEYCGQFRAESSYTQGAEFGSWVSRGSRPASAISRVIVLRRLPQA
jgi:hypothetical protein